MKSFDEFLERRFPDSRRKAYYLMAIHEHLHAGSEAATAPNRLDESNGTCQGGAQGGGAV